MEYTRRSKYREQAETYDRTRRASVTVGRLLLRHLGEAGGRTVVDLAGGTGNYAEVVAAAGFRTFILDLTPEMLARSVPKIGAGRQVLADVHRLPIRDGALDAAMCVSAIHQFPNIPAALREARRVIREGPYVLQAFTAESLKPSFVFDYFPDPGAPEAMHPTEAEFEELLHEAGFERVVAERFVYDDLSDGTVHALQIDPEATADEERLRNTSFFQKLAPEVQRAGLAALRRDLESGLLAERVAEGMKLAEEYGHGVVFAAWP